MNLWENAGEIAADEVYRERQVYVTGSVLTTNIICGEVGAAIWAIPVM